MYIVAFFGSCMFLYLMYEILDGYGSFNNYVTKNFIKGIYLALLFFAGTIFIIPYFFTYNLNNNLVKCFGSLYASNDFMGLMKVKLNLTTLFHHLVTSVFLLYIWQTDFNSNPISRAILIYTYLSSASFAVNIYLAVRFMGDFTWLRNKVKWIYLITFILNVSMQFFIVSTDSFISYVYVSLLMLIVVDDIYLLKWLFYI